jgi:hypothetical protein
MPYANWGERGNMPYYRLYFISPRSGGIHRFEEVEAADDVDAVRLAGERVGREPMELWCRGRRVKCFEGAAPQQLTG